VQVEKELPSQPGHRTVTYREYYTRCRINTSRPPDDEHSVARNMYRITIINFYITQLCNKLVIYSELYQDARSAKHKILRCTISQHYFGKERYMFRTDLLSTIRSLNTVFTATGICHTSYVDRLLARWGWNKSRPFSVNTALRILIMNSKSVRKMQSSLPN